MKPRVEWNPFGPISIEERKQTKKLEGKKKKKLPQQQRKRKNQSLVPNQRFRFLINSAIIVIHKNSISKKQSK